MAQGSSPQRRFAKNPVLAALLALVIGCVWITSTPAPLGGFYLKELVVQRVTDSKETVIRDPAVLCQVEGFIQKQKFGWTRGFFYPIPPAGQFVVECRSAIWEPFELTISYSDAPTPWIGLQTLDAALGPGKPSVKKISPSDHKALSRLLGLRVDENVSEGSP